MEQFVNVVDADDDVTEVVHVEHNYMNLLVYDYFHLKILNMNMKLSFFDRMVPHGILKSENKNIFLEVILKS